jgi:phage portal protein BeeE
LATALAPPAMQLIPTDMYMSWLPKDKARKTVLPKNPTVAQLRNFSKEPIVRKAITIVQDALARQQYVIEIIGGRGKFTKQIAMVKNIIEHPNVIDGRESFVKRIFDDALVLDALTVEVARADDTTHPLYLYPIDGSTIRHVVPYDYSDPNAARYVQQQADGIKYFTSDEVAYLQRSYFTYQPYGLSPVMSAYNYIKYYLDALGQSNTKATNNTADYIIGLHDVSSEERERFVQYFKEEIEGTGRIPIVSGTSLETKQIRSGLGEMSYLKWQEFLTTVIGVAFGLPPERLGIMIANDRSTGDDQENIVMQELIKPYSSMYENLINTYVIGKLGLGGILKFKLMYEDSESLKTQKSKRMIEEYYRGAITENEFREKMGYDLSDNKYAGMTYPEKTANINVDLGIAGGFAGNGMITDTSDDDKST